MKHFVKLTAILLFFCLAGLYAKENQTDEILAKTWQPVSDYPAAATDGAVAFEINGKGYVGGGFPGIKDFWSYDPETDHWEKLADLCGGNPKAWAINFVVDGIAYVGGGASNSNISSVTKDFWKYNQETNVWTKLNDFPGGVRDGCFAFSINGKAYVGGGFSGQFLHDDVYEYNPQNDTWVQLEGYPGGPVIFASAFVIDGKAYVGLGAGTNEYNTLFEFNPQTKTWLEKASFPGTPRQSSVAYTMNGKGYIAGGEKGYNQTFTECYSYNPKNNKWENLNDMQLPDAYTAWSCGFSIGENMYFGTGAKLPEFQFSKKFYKYSFGSEQNEPTISIDKENIDFGKVSAGYDKKMKFFVSNTGNADLIISNIYFEDDFENEMILENNSPLPNTIAAGSSKEYTLKFSPESINSYSTSLIIFSNDMKMVSSEIFIDGEGVEFAPGLELNLTELNFDKTQTGESIQKSFKIKNTGSAILTVSEIVLSGNGKSAFEILNQLPEMINGNDELTVNVKFNPEEAILYQAIATINSDAVGKSPFINLEGTGENISSVEDNTGISELKFSISPDSRICRVTFNGNELSDMLITLSDFSGNIIKSENQLSVAGINTFDIKLEDSNANNLSSGTYFITLKSAIDLITFKLILMN